MQVDSILAIIIAYNPDVTLLQNNIEAIINYVGKIVIWMNSDIDIEKVNRGVCTERKIEWRGNRINMGIGLPLNLLLKEFSTYEYVLTMDQDSIWHGIDAFLSEVAVRIDNEKAIYGPRIVAEAGIDSDMETHEVDHVITSGCFAKSRTYKEVGYFDERMFVDALDEDICYKAKQRGYKIIQIANGYLRQQYGDPQMRRFLWKRIAVIKYSAQRMCYIARNHIVLIRRYKIKGKQRMKLLYKYVLRPLAEAMIYHKQKLQIVRSIIAGIHDGIRFDKRRMENEQIGKPDM